MFTDDEAKIIVSRFMLILEEEKAGHAKNRKILSEILVDAAREYLAGRYNANFGKDDKDGITKLSDVVSREDFGR